MKRWVTALIGLAVVVLVVVMVAHFRPPLAVGRDLAAAGSGAHADDGGLMALGGDGGPPGDVGTPLLWTDLAGVETRADGGGAGMTMPDGSPVPPLPFTVPRQIRFGVVLVSYAGAQPSAGGVRPMARSKSEARGLASRLLVTAQQDFHAAVQQGDTGSADDIGHVKAGILEPAPEYVLFTLPVAGIGGPVDTPRGYWIVKRLE